MKYLILFASIWTATTAFAHGEDKTGPHGGFIRMPGAYHTEVVLVGKNQAKVYLLDMQWKNPTTKKSSVEVLLQQKGTTAPLLSCRAQGDFFLCNFPEGTDLTAKGTLTVTSKRLEHKGNQTVYDLPLKLQSPATAQEDHSAHH